MMDVLLFVRELECGGVAIEFEANLCVYDTGQTIVVDGGIIFT